MTSASPQDDPEVRRAQEERLKVAWRTPTGLSYVTAVNNTEVGKWYLATAFGFFLFAGVLALLMRAQLAVPGNDLLSADTYNQVMTLHGSAMMFLFAVPIFEASAILLLPQMLGSRDMPFPRLSAYGYWSFLIGGSFVLGSIFFDVAPTGGWFMYPPMTTQYTDGLGPDLWLLGLAFIEIAAIAAAVELIVGVLKCRPPGMRINLMPLYGWYVLVVGGMIIFGFPPLIAGDLLFELERAFDWPFFDPTRGGDPILWQHLFWIFGHPEVYIIFLPSVALVAMIVPTFARTPLVGYSWIVLAAVGTGFLSFGLWVHHMYTIGLPVVSQGFFSAASTAVAIPTGVQIFAFIATMLVGRVVMSVPLLFVAGGLAIFVIGGLTGVMVALAPFDWQAHDTHFVVAHLHYVLIGGMLFPIIAGLYYYYPLVSAKMLSDRLGKWAFWLMFVGFNVTFLPMHITGLRGMPRRVFTYEDGLGLGWLNLTSSVGAAILAAGVLVVVVDVLRPKGRQPLARRNPWNAGNLEWMGEMPMLPWGARTVPFIRSRYPLWDDPDFLRKIDEGRFYLPDAAEERRETLVTSVLDAEPEQCLRVPGPSLLPLSAAVFTSVAFIAPVFKAYEIAVGGGAVAVALIIVWLWTGTLGIPETNEKDVGLGLHLPIYRGGPESVGWWAMFITMLGSATAYASLVFGYFYYWTVHETWPPEDYGDLGLVWPGAAAALVLLTWATAAFGVRLANAGSSLAATGLWVLAALLGLAAAGAAGAGPYHAGLDPAAHAYPAMVWVILGWGGIHALIFVIMSLYCAARLAAGRMAAGYAAEGRIVLLFWHFTGLMLLVGLAIAALFPLAT